MKKLTILGVLALSACTTATQIQSECFKLHPESFKMATNCTKEQILSHPMANQHDAEVEYYVNLLDVTTEKVESGKMSYAEGKLVLSEKLLEMKQHNAMLSAAQQPAPQPRPQQTTCNTIGNQTYCNTY